MALDSPSRLTRRSRPFDDPSLRMGPTSPRLAAVFLLSTSCTAPKPTRHISSPKTRGLLVPRRGQMTVQRLGNPSAFAEGEVCRSFLLNGVLDYATQNRRTGESWIGGGALRAMEATDDHLGVACDAQDSVVARAHTRNVMLPRARECPTASVLLASGTTWLLSWPGLPFS